MMDIQYVKVKNRQETQLESTELNVGNVDFPEIISILKGLLLERAVSKKSLAVLSLFCSDLAFRAICQKGGSYLQRKLETQSRSLMRHLCCCMKKIPRLNLWLLMIQHRSPVTNYLATIFSLTLCLLYYCQKFS